MAPTKFLFVFAQAHSNFRTPELLSIAELNAFSISIPPDADPSRPFMILELESENHARLLAERCILIKSIYEFYAQGSTYKELHESNLASRPIWARHAQSSFKFTVIGYQNTLSASEQRQIIESFDYMDYQGKIDMTTPEVVLGVFQEHESKDGSKQGSHKEPGKMLHIYFGRLVVEGTARSLAGKFDVKKRIYYGNTSMEAEMSLLMANQSLAAHGKLMYDPFIGTGSMAYASTIAHFGAQVYGSDIDGRQMRGKEKKPGIIRAAAQYGVVSRIIDLCTFDVTNNPWRCGDLFDGIVTDPPYGVRAGAKRLGRKNAPREKHQAALKQQAVGQQRPGDTSPYMPPTKPYEFSHLASDLVVLARYLLRPGGRLVFFVPTVNENYQEIDIDSMLCEGMEIVSNSLQDYGSWGRRLITIRKTTTASYPPPVFEPQQTAPSGDEGALEAAQAHIPAHKDFREKYFQGFKAKEVAA